MVPTLPRTLAALAFSAGLLALPSKAAAAAALQGPHRIEAEVGLGVTRVSADDDGHWRETSWAPGFSLSYAYAAIPNLELGATLRYWDFGMFNDQSTPAWNDGEDGIHHGLAPSLIARLHTNTRVEWGATLGGGFLYLSQQVPDDQGNFRAKTASWYGWQVSLALDARIPITDKWAVQVGPAVVLGSGHDGSEGSRYYLRRDAGLTSLGVWIGGVFAP